MLGLTDKDQLKNLLKTLNDWAKTPTTGTWCSID